MRRILRNAKAREDLALEQTEPPSHFTVEVELKAIEERMRYRRRNYFLDEAICEVNARCWPEVMAS